MHVEFKQLVLRFTGYPFPGEVHAVPHVEQCVYVFHLHHVGFVMGEIGIVFDLLCNFTEGISFLKFDIYHSAMNPGSRGDSHRQGGLYSFDCFNGYCMSHTHARTEVGISQPLGCTGFQ